MRWVWRRRAARPPAGSGGGTEAFKFLQESSKTVITEFEWPLPSGGEAGEWVEAARVDPCRSGIHASDADHLAYWMSDRLWVIELDGPVEVARHKLVARRGRLLRPVPAWHERIREEFISDVVWRWRDRALDSLAGSAVSHLSDSLASAGSVGDLAALGQLFGSDPGEGTHPRTAVLLVADCASAAQQGRAVAVGFRAACLAGHLAGPERSGKAAYEEAFHAERVRQSRWIAARIS